MQNKKEKTHALRIEGDLSSEVHLRSDIGDAQLSKTHSDLQNGNLRWTLMKGGKRTRSYTIWTRLEATDDTSDAELVEVVSEEDKEQVLALHSAKAAFKDDQQWLKLRIHSNERSKVHCRSWALKVGGKIVAAATVRLNPYINRSGVAWAQIMNVSVARERLGHGTRMVAGLEELLWRERVDVVVLYPVPNNRADNFWKSMGYTALPESLLPSEELDPKNKALCPEGYEQHGVRTILPRWEKTLFRDYPHPEASDDARKRTRIQLPGGDSDHLVDTHDEGTWKALERAHWPLWRRTAANASTISGEELQRRAACAVEFKECWKAKWLRAQVVGQVSKVGGKRALSSHPTVSTTDNSQLADISELSVATTISC
jgi:hypothetical protein